MFTVIQTTNMSFNPVFLQIKVLISNTPAEMVADETVIIEKRKQQVRESMTRVENVQGRARKSIETSEGYKD